MRAAALIAGLALAPLTASAGDFFTLEGHGGPVKGIAVSPKGDAILTASFDNSVGLWRDGKPLWLEGHEAAVNAVAWVDETRAVSAGDDFSLWLWDILAGTGQRLGAHKGKVMSLAVSPDGTTLASASWDGSVGLWPLASPGSPRFLDGHGGGVNAVLFSSDGATLYSGAADGTLRTWRVADGTATGLIKNNGFGINTLALNEAAGWIAFGGVDGATQALSIADGQVIADLTLDRRPILAMAMSPDGALLAIGDGEGYISLIDTADWRFTVDFHATLRGPVWALAFSADGTNIHAGGLDDAMYSWPIDDTEAAPQMVEGERPFLKGAEAASNGERQFNRKCSVCHTLEPDGRRRAGPTLHRLFGRAAGSVPGYVYSEALATSDIVWTPETIDALFDLGPEVYVEGTKMPMQRIVLAQDRADLVDFLRGATGSE